MDLVARAGAHAALGDARRLLIVDHLALGDRSVAELGEISDLRPGNLLAHHLDVLESTGLIERRVSEGDKRRKYVSLRWDRLPPPLDPLDESIEDIVFVCTHNSARSQFAAAMWEQATGHRAESAGRTPAQEVHPTAVRVAEEFGVDLSSATPGGYERLAPNPDLVVSVCDLAREANLPRARRHLHWSVPDPLRFGSPKSFRSAFGEISRRVQHLAGRIQDG